LNALETARLILTELIDLGVRDAVLAPGSRSAPFAYALAELDQRHLVRVHVRTDERVAGFTALGLSLSTHRPVPVITTSGTAVGELLPAVMEASHAGAQLIVLSADRPDELRGTGANQTTVQPGMFANFVRDSLDIPAGPSGTSFLTGIRGALAAAAGTSSAPAGPLHLNVAFRDPLAPAPGWTPAQNSAALDRTQAEHPDGTLDAVVEPTDPLGAEGLDATEGAGGIVERRTVVVAGHGAGEAAAFFAQRHRLPLLAEPSSNARFGPNAIAAYRILLPRFSERIERVVVIGRPTLSRPVAALINRTDIERALYLPVPAPWFEPGRRAEQQISSLTELGAFAGQGPEGWLESWQDAGADADARIHSLLASEESRLSGMHIADAVWEASDGNLVIGASNIIRDMDLVAAADWHPVDVYANRGLAGIDGTVSTAMGIALGSGIPTRVVLGDLTFLHDAGTLAAVPGEPRPCLQVVVLNDGGGRIFGLLEHGTVGRADAGAAPSVERFFGTPHTVDLGALCAGYGVRHTRVTCAEELFAALDAPLDGVSVVEIPVEAGRAEEMAVQVRDLFASCSK
jgi:2-succinyl-5-enolpyruvyl-6-hydroxy-3-cyclohexene-1-carboxylate synthase